MAWTRGTAYSLTFSVPVLVLQENLLWVAKDPLQEVSEDTSRLQIFRFWIIRSLHWFSMDNMQVGLLFKLDSPNRFHWIQIWLHTDHINMLKISLCESGRNWHPSQNYICMVWFRSWTKLLLKSPNKHSLLMEEYQVSCYNTLCFPCLSGTK